MKPRLLIIAIISVGLIFVFTLTNEAYACSCASEIDYDQIIADADTAFQGTVMKIEEGSGFQKVHFVIHSVQKGDLEAEYFVMTNVNIYMDENKNGMHNSCDPDYVKGNTYQVIGWGSTEQNPVGETNMCSTRTIQSIPVVLHDLEEFEFNIWPTESIVKYPDFPTIEFTLTPTPSGSFESFYIEAIDELVPENNILVVYKIKTPDGNTETSIGHFHLNDITQYLTKVSFGTPIAGEYTINGMIYLQTDGKLFSLPSNSVTITVIDPVFRGMTDEIMIDQKLNGVELFDWSTDGSLILFRYVENFGTDEWQHRLATMTPDGKNIVVLPIQNLTHENQFHDARFSPDGNYVHVSMDDRNLYRFDINTEEIIQLTHQEEILDFDFYHYNEDKPQNYSIIISVENEDATKNSENFILLDIGNGEQENSILDAHALVFDFPSHTFDISSDGKKILFKKTNDAGYGWADRVLAYQPAQGDIVEIPNIQANCGSPPKWSPNGEMIIYNVNSCGRGASGGTLHLINLDGSYHETLVPYTNYNPSHFIISPDGSSIIYGMGNERDLRILTLAKPIPEFGTVVIVILFASMTAIILTGRKSLLGRK